LHEWGAADNEGHRLSASEMAELAPERNLFSRPFDGLLQNLDLERFGEEVHGAFFHGFYSFIDLTVSCDDYELRLPGHIRDFIQQGKTGAVRQPDIQNTDISAVLIQASPGFLECCRFQDLIIVLTEAFGDGLTSGIDIVYDQYGCTHI
jgi:hypothetical protein